jgi:hypothetical protein
MGQSSGCLPLPVVLFLARNLGGFRQHSRQSGVEHLLQQGKQLVADAIAGMPGVEVGGILAPGLSRLLKEKAQLATARIQQQVVSLAGASPGATTSTG